MLTQQQVKELFDYRDGNLYWRKRSSYNVPAGSKAGCFNGFYKVIRINKRGYYAHRLIFLWHNGFLPAEVDHKDLNKKNNRIENLRSATSAANKLNVPLKATNTSGYKNVDWHKPRNKWRVQIRIKHKLVHIGYFNDLELADLVAQEARNKYHGDFARHD